MRFKTRVRVEKIPDLLRLAQTLEKLEKLCVLHLQALDQDTVRFVVTPTVEGSVAAYAQISTTAWFEGYRIESQNSNQIGLEMDLQNLIRALRSAAAADEVHVKLAKKGVPVLTFEIRTCLGPIMQDVPVTVMSAGRLADCVEPTIESGVRGFTLPALGRLYGSVDRMRGLGTRLELHAKIGDRFGNLSVQMLNENVSIATEYQRLPRASMGDEEGVVPESEDDVVRLECTVDLKNLKSALHGHTLQPKHGMCFILKHSVLIHLMGDGARAADVSYFIPRCSQ